MDDAYDASKRKLSSEKGFVGSLSIKMKFGSRSFRWQSRQAWRFNRMGKVETLGLRLAGIGWKNPNGIG
jgi:hypothetical protein